MLNNIHIDKSTTKDKTTITLIDKENNSIVYCGTYDNYDDINIDKIKQELSL